MKSEFYKANPLASSQTLAKGSVRRDFLETLVTNYQDPSKCDKLTEAQEKVVQIKHQMQDNLRNIAANRDVMIVIIIVTIGFRREV